MRSLKIIEHISLDGVIQHSADGTDFPYADWNVPYRTVEGRDAVTAAHGENFDLLLGRRTYDLWAAFWPTAPASPIGDRINAATKYVVTHRPDTLTWGPHQAMGADVVRTVERIKAQDGPGIVVSGSSTIAASVLQNGLADEVVLVTYPLLLGTGKRLLGEGLPAQTLIPSHTTTTPSGVCVTTYRPAGPLAPTEKV
jgi:dihydrofolate reductase